ncbi:MAG: hypothetical protein AAGB48_07355 [Planctomycetota bacterium]
MLPRRTTLVLLVVGGLVMHVGLALGLAWLLPPQLVRGGVFTTRVVAQADRTTPLTRIRIDSHRFGQRWSWEMLASHGYGVSSGSRGASIDILNIMPASDPKLETIVVPRRASLRSYDPDRAETLATGGEPGIMARWPIEHSAGWPTPALRCWDSGVYWVWGATAYTGQRGLLDGGIAIGAGGGGPSHTLPLTPVWPGLMAGTLFWAGVLWSMLLGRRAIVRAVRRRRGRCLACGYALAGLPLCPECGLPSSNASSAPATNAAT